MLRRPRRLAGRDLRQARSRRPRAAQRRRARRPVRRAGAPRGDGRVERRLGDAPEDGEQREAFGEAATPVYLFGAGHVGRALALALAPLPFTVRWIDPRPDEFPKLAPANVTMVAAADPPAELEAAPDGALVLAITHSHPLDLAVVAAALRQDRFAYVGMIGSATKRARFASQFARGGRRGRAHRETRLPDRLSRDRRQGARGDRRRRRRAIADGAGGSVRGCLRAPLGAHARGLAQRELAYWKVRKFGSRSWLPADELRSLKPHAQKAVSIKHLVADIVPLVMNFFWGAWLICS